MTGSEWIALGLTGASLALVALVLVGYPLLVSLLARRRADEPVHALADPELPAVSVIVAVRNGEALVADKVANTLALDYPENGLELVVVSDGSTDGTLSALRAVDDTRVVVRHADEHRGKAWALNRAVEEARGDVLVFTDADALLAPDALRRLVDRLGDPAVGGVCGQRRIRGDELAVEGGPASQGDAQARYISFDSRIKRDESRIGSITSNDGKLYAIRRELFRPVPDAVTDDLFQGLSVVAQERRFVFEPRAVARIRVPSRGARHELGRRRRIVARSLRGIYLNRVLLNPFRHGAFAFQLAINKVLRRLLPFALVALLLASVLLAWTRPLAWGLVVLQLAAYLAAWSLRRTRTAPKVLRLLSYFCVGNLGTMLGVMDFAQRRFVSKWDPVKADAGA